MNEIPAVLADEAAERWAAFDLGLMDWAQIMAWADGWILRLDTHPELLLDVSLSVTRPKDGATALKGMADESRRTTLVPYLKAIWRENGSLARSAAVRWSVGRGEPVRPSPRMPKNGPTSTAWIITLRKRLRTGSLTRLGKLPNICLLRRLRSTWN